MQTQEQEESHYMAMMHVDVVLPRLICAFLVHLLMEPDVKQALSMLKYVINHRKIRGSLQELCDKVFKEKIYFIRDKFRKPSEYLYVEKSKVKANDVYINAKYIMCKDKNGKEVPVELEQIKAQKFKLSKIGKQVTDVDLQIAFVLLKRAQRIFGRKCKHPRAPEIDFIFDQIGEKRFEDSSGKRIDIKKEWKANNWCTQVDFSSKEICGLFKSVGEFYAHKKTDDIMFRGSID